MASDRQLLSITLQEWNGSFTYNGTPYNYVMVGANPASNEGALIATWIIPVKIVLPTGETYDPLSGGVFSPLARTVLGGVDVGTTRDLDAFQARQLLEHRLQ